MDTKTENAGVTTYSWIDEDRLANVTTPNSIIGYDYDADNSRIRTNTGTDVKYYLIDKSLPYGQVVAEYDSLSSLKCDYVYGLERISQSRNSVVHYYVADGQGSIRGLTDTAGNVTDVYYYTAFGEELAKSGTTENEFRYVGEQWDPNAEFYYLRARWMDPGTGRFMSVDPYAGDPQAPVSLHRYLYAGISPLNYVDPSGESYLNMLYTLSIMSTLAARYTPAMVQVVQWANRIVPSSVSLANNLIRAGFARPAGTAAHHIVAGLAQIAYPARSILFKYGVEINEVANGMFLKSATHWGIHSMKYYNRVNALLRNATSKEDVIKILNFIKAEIEAGRFP